MVNKENRQSGGEQHSQRKYIDMSMKRVLEVIRQGQIGGGESHLADLIELMDKESFEPICLSFTSGEMIDRLEAMGVRCHVIDSSRGFDLSVQKKVMNLIRQEKIDIIHAHGTRAASNVLLPVMRMGLPFVYTVHGWSFHDDQGWLTYNARRLSEKLICSRANRVICVSEGNALTGKEAFGLKPPMVIKNGVNLNKFNPDIASSLSRSDFGFALDDFVVGFIARCTKQKAPLDFLSAIERSHATDNSIKGLFIGEGDMDAAVDNFIADHQMSSYVFRSPFRTDVPDLLRMMDTFCLPSLWEGLSIGLLEAMAMGKAIIVTPTDGTREVIVHEHSGLIVPFSSPEQISDNIIRLKSDSELRIMCGSNARQLVSTRFNAQNVADAVAKVYQQVMR